MFWKRQFQINAPLSVYSASDAALLNSLATQIRIVYMWMAFWLALFPQTYF